MNGLRHVRHAVIPHHAVTAHDLLQDRRIVCGHPALEIVEDILSLEGGEHLLEIHFLGGEEGRAIIWAGGLELAEQKRARGGVLLC